ncbi:MAG: hypothetical protein V3T83_06730, partial [Acidobacteriota bacterium]
MTITGLDLSFSGEKPTGTGLRLDGVPVRAFQFNGADHQLSHSPFAGAVARTIEAWVEPRQRGEYTVLFKGDAAAGEVDYSLGLDADGKVVFEHRATGPGECSNAAVRRCAGGPRDGSRTENRRRNGPQDRSQGKSPPGPAERTR